jgi:hypothetical protein
MNTRAAVSNRFTGSAKATSQCGEAAKEDPVATVIPFRSPRIPSRGVPEVLLYRLSLVRAKAQGICPEPANDTRPDSLWAGREEQ